MIMIMKVKFEIALKMDHAACLYYQLPAMMIVMMMIDDLVSQRTLDVPLWMGCNIRHFKNHSISKKGAC